LKEEKNSIGYPRTEGFSYSVPKSHSSFYTPEEGGWEEKEAQW